MQVGTSRMVRLDFEKLRAAKVESEPFAYALVPAFLDAESIKAVNATYPPISQGGSFPTQSLVDGMAIKDVIAALDGPTFEAIVAEKFRVDLQGKPKMYSLRGYVRGKDGKIHTDSKDKIITVLLYLNEHWHNAGGRLRLLRDANDLENYAAEVPPDNGTLLIFKRSENSWHGHAPFEGPRRTLQMNWMTSEGSKGFHALRHKLSAAAKKLATGSA